MPDVIERSPYEQTVKRWSALDTEYSSWRTHYREISDYLLPRQGRFFHTDRNRGTRRHNRILDSAGTRAHGILSAGMMAGMTSPARPWLRLAVPDRDLMKWGPVKVWLADTTTLMLEIFQRSNTYRALHSIYGELGGFGTGASVITSNFDRIIHHHPLTTGEFRISQNAEGQVDTLYRQFDMTVAQVVKEFGIDRVSSAVKNMYDAGNLDAWVTVIHAIEPRADRDIRKRDAINMRYRSLYFELGADSERQPLRESGFRQFRAVCPRWEVYGGDIYGTSPGMVALGDVSQLQHEQLRKSKAIDYQTDPPLQVPGSLKNQPINTLPGGTTYVDQPGPNNSIRTAFDVNLNLNYLLADIQDVRARIDSAFYADLFLMLSNQVDARMTATEVAERHEEKMLMLGPVLERLQNELLDPMVDITFSEMLAAGILPPPPEELMGVELNVEYVSMLAQAQRAVSTNSIDRFVGNLGVVAQMKPEVLDKLDADKWADAYADKLGIDPELIVADDKVALIRQQRAAAAAQAQQAAMAEQLAGAAGKLGAVKTDQPNALTDVTRAFSGYT